MIPVQSTLLRIKSYYKFIDRTCSRPVHLNVKGWVLSLLGGSILMLLWLLTKAVGNIFYSSVNDTRGVIVITSLCSFFLIISLINMVSGLLSLDFNLILKGEAIVIFISNSINYLIEDGYRSIGDNYFGQQIVMYRMIFKALDWLSEKNEIAI